MATVKLKDARARLGELVAAAEKGQCTILTRRGRRVAVIGPAPGRPRLPDLTEFRSSLKLEGKPLSETVIANRREARH